MKQISRAIAGVTMAIALGVAVAIIAHRTFAADTPLPTPKFIVQSTPVDRVAHVTSFSPIIKKAAPSVVNIYSIKDYHAQTQDDSAHRSFWDDDSDSHPRHSHGYESIGLGSGVIVSSDGYILTASHVIEGADQVKVSLADGEKQLDVRVVGSDPATDVAVLKVDAKDLPAITLADSDKLEVGDVALA
ncbi:MAG TPA: trypsin-like peptidase domain-containing protein, partial [Verrucomicrobiae bacterium]|nr:trypsin-like peptidase domain-containing protein [Verrucomicrobiae bacterium]